MTQGEPRRRALRADAQRNHEDIRRAALAVFREGGLTVPLELVAKAAGVSKGTIYHRFAGRDALVDAVIDDLARLHIDELIADCNAIVNPADRFEHYLDGMWRLQYDEPAVCDVVTRQVPDSAQLSELCARASGVAERYLSDAQAGGSIRPELTSADVFRFIRDRGIVFRAEGRPDRSDDERHRRYLIDGLLARR
ncbi:TetR/AcrR family transcriptional regulator [Microbacterium sp. NPDC077663]|uniref:TetR/AcrR family transcriptional regulator n=1 Tax=Microbacterium sp. NPDC077663 TaxID=3364189 RepID=UPI0037C521F1